MKWFVLELSDPSTQDDKHVQNVRQNEFNSQTKAILKDNLVFFVS